MKERFWVLLQLGAMVLRAPEDGAGAGGGPGGGAPPADGASPADAGADAAGDGGAGAGDAGPWRPDGLPEDLAGASDRETLEKLWGRYTEAQAAAAGGADADAYAVEWQGEQAEQLAAMFPADDPLYVAARQAAHKHGLAPQKFQGFMQDVFGPAFAGGLLQPPFNPARELGEFGQRLGLSDQAEISRAHGERVAFVQGLSRQMELSERAATELEILSDLSGGLEVIDALQKLLTVEGIKVDADTSPAAAFSKTDLEKLDGDERIDPSSPKYDPALRKRYDAAYAKLYR